MAAPAVASAPTALHAAATPSAPPPRPAFGLPERSPAAAALAPVVADRRSVPGLAATVAARAVYAGGDEPATLQVTNTADAPASLSVVLVRQSSGAVVARWTPGPLAAGATRAITWHGAARTGRFQFQVWSSPLSTVPQLADSLRLQPDAFPVDGRHDYGIAGEGRFGTGRSGHMHQGQDVFAACGTPVRAARAGRVQFEEFQASAGNYVVIDGDGTDQDTAYMHLREPALPAVGEHVATGQLIGYVGDTGDASECHLHFELWTAPGWYEGGRPVDPLPFLKRWDA